MVQKFSNLNNLLLKKKNILILGSGYVVPPVLDFFSKYPDISVTIGTNTPDEARKALKLFDDYNIIGIDVLNESERLENLINESDLVIRYINILNNYVF